MSKHTRRFLHLAASVALTTRLVGAQERAPSRPELPADADTNDARSYFRLAETVIEKEPRKAADAYYWAIRLNPVWAEAYYGRRTALLLRDPRKLTRYVRGDRDAAASAEILAIDSLYLYALTLNPFVGPKLEHLLIWAVTGQSGGDPSLSSMSGASVNARLESYYNRPEVRAAWEYRSGNYDEALRLYGIAISRSDRKAALRTQRGRLFYQIGRHDSALAELTSALEEMRKQDKEDFVFLYESKALMEQRIGMIHHVMGNDSAAREAFGRALQEDLSYFPAHVQLGYLALDAADTTTAATEMDLAVQIRPDDPGLRYQYGYTLASLKKLPEAEKQLRSAIAIDPDYAVPHFVLGQVLEARSQTDNASIEYQSFLARAPRVDPRRDEALARVQALKSNH